MPQSMTGYGRGECNENNMECVIEIKSVNHRYCDMFVKLPRDLIGLEDSVRKFISGKVSRGKLEIFITFDDRSVDAKKLEVNYALADAYRSVHAEIAKRYGIKDVTDSATVLGFPSVLEITRDECDLDKVWGVLGKALSDAMVIFISMRETEGENLKNDLLLRVEKIDGLLREIEKRSPFVVIEYRNKLEGRISDILMKTDIIDEQRLAQEVAIFADKASIDEEIVRLRSHLSQMKDILSIQTTPIGRKLDFLVQEMNREANTIGSKSNDTSITKSMLEIKSEIEKIREQVQNIE